MEPSLNSSDDISKKMESMSITTTREKIRLTEEEAIRLGVELSVLIARAMFLLSSDIRSMLCFCFLTFKRAWNQQDGPVVKRVLCVMQHVYEKYIKPKNGVYKDGDKFVYMELIRTLLRSFIPGFGGLDLVVHSVLGGVNNLSVVEKCNLMMIRMDLEEQLKYVTEANGYPREAIEADILHIWKDLFDTTSQERNQHVDTTYPELFRPFLDERKRHNVFIDQLASLSI